MKHNLKDLKEIRDDVEHHLFGRADVKWLPLFQACCLNFEKMMCSLFGESLSFRDVLVKYKAADEYYPYKPNVVSEMVRNASGKPFNAHNHTQAWKLFKARPLAGAEQPENTNKDYSIYHAAHGDYTYSKKWVDFLTEQMSSDEGEKAIKSFKQ